MDFIGNVIQYILGFEAYVLLPILMFILCLVVGIKIMDGLKHSLTLGIGFLGIFMVFDFFVSKLGPAIEAIALRNGSEMAILDVGWPPLAASAWSFYLVPILIILIMAVNGILLYFKLTNTVNIDIWNFWHFIFAGQMIYYTTQSVVMTIVVVLVAMVITLKIGDWSSKRVEAMSHIPGITITTLSSLCYYPVALFVDTIIGRIPKIKNINGRPEHLREKVGFFGDSRFIGLVMGLGIGISAGYNLRDVLELGVSVAGVVFILPKMANILGEGLIPISEGVKDFIIQKYPKLKDARMGMDVAVIVGMPEVIVSGILVMPIAVLLSMVLPGVRFTPLGDLPNVIGAGAMIVIATRGNIFRSVLAYIPIVIGKLYAATALAGLYTNIVISSHIDVNNFMGEVTSFQDGGNLFRTFLYYLFTGHSWTYLVLPLVLALLWFTYRVYKKENIES